MPPHDVHRPSGAGRSRADDWLLSICLTVVGWVFVERVGVLRHARGVPLYGDALEYLAMIRGPLQAAREPFCNRPLGPWLARLVPGDPKTALACVTLAALAVTYFLVLRIGRSLRLSRAALLSALLIGFLSNWHLYLYHNPYLTYALGLCGVTQLFAAFIGGAFPWFLLAAVVLPLGRETVLGAVPLWGVRHRGQGVLVFLVVAGLLGIVHLAIRGLPADSGPREILRGHLAHAPAFASHAFQAWGFLWIPALLYVVHPRLHCPSELRIWFACLFGTGLLSATAATDVERMFQVLFPALTLALAGLFGALPDRARWLRPAGLALSIGYGLVALPNVVLHYQGESANWPKLLILGLGLLWNLCVLNVFLRPDTPESADLRKA